MMHHATMCAHELTCVSQGSVFSHEIMSRDVCHVTAVLCCAVLWWKTVLWTSGQVPEGVTSNPSMPQRELSTPHFMLRCTVPPAGKLRASIWRWAVCPYYD